MVTKRMYFIVVLRMLPEDIHVFPYDLHSKCYRNPRIPNHPRLEEALQSGDLQKVRAAVAQQVSTPWTRWVAAAYYLNKNWKPTAGGQFVDMDKSKEVPKPGLKRKEHILWPI